LRLGAYLRQIAKAAIQGVSLLAALPFAALAGFGHFSPAFQGFAHLFALLPGLPGDYLRVAYYVLTLRKCSLHSRVSFGSFFAQSSAVVGKQVYIGAYCVLGTCDIGERTQIASHVQILGGRHQHERAANGRIMGANEQKFATIVIGADCWIGASAIIMADIGEGTTIGAGTVVTRPVAAKVVAVGNPARPIGATM
jgi:acetyltransferase-like isoleucine patch superfamily enzyme